MPRVAQFAVVVVLDDPCLIALGPTDQGLPAQELYDLVNATLEKARMSN